MARMTLNRYAVGTQSFSALRREGALYVDKTEFV